MQLPFVKKLSKLIYFWVDLVYIFRLKKKLR